MSTGSVVLPAYARRVPLRHAVLALLSERSSYGYQLKTRFETALGPQWGSLNIGHLYQVLDRLVRDGYATRERVVQQTRPDRQIYRITRDGRAELHRWLAEGQLRSTSYRDELILKLFAAARVGPAALSTAVDAQRAAYLDELTRLDELERQRAGDPLQRLLARGARLHTQADLAITDAAAVDLAPLAAARIKPSGSGPARPARRAR